MSTTLTCPAGKIREGDSLPGLDNGYVFMAVEPAADRLSWHSGYQMSAVDAGLVIVSFHTAEGDEAHLVCPENMPVTVDTDDTSDREFEDES